MRQRAIMIVWEKTPIGAILVTVDKKDYPEDHPLSGIAFQRALEKKAFEAG